MCGLAWLYGAQPADPLRSRMETALTRMAHRGPDADGIEAGECWAMGHRRLSIIDLAGSPQPMWDATRRYVLAYNGELYNYRALRGVLAADHAFRTQGDTEVVLVGLIRHGPDFLDRMDGMWAIVLWDTLERRLLLARDRLGEKPLYYSARTDAFCCASELPALRALLPEAPLEDLDSTADYLRYGYALPGHTAYRDVHEVLPAHWLEWSPGQSPRGMRYWRLPETNPRLTSHEAHEQLPGLLNEAVRSRLEADVEVGAFLSGGLDSSLLVSSLVRHCGVSPQTFTIGFEEASFDERAPARRTAALFATRHHEERLQSLESAELERLLLEHVGQPFADASLLPTALVSRLAARHVKVALSGDGGDELFSGYQRYQARVLWRWYTRLPSSLRRLTGRVLGALPVSLAHHSASLLKKAQLFMESAERMGDETPYLAPRFYSEATLRELAPALAGRGHDVRLQPEATHLDDLDAMMRGDALAYLPQDILVKVDRAAMAASLETRAPFLARDLVEFAFAFPGRLHRHGFTGKRLLRDACHDWLPPDIWRRRKQGFGVPVGHWFMAALGESLTDALRADPGPLSPAPILMMLDEHRAGRRDHGLRLWLIHVYLLWRREALAG